MALEDYICNNLQHVKTEKTDCYDIQVYKCKKFNCIFDEFHDRCEGCKDDTTRILRED